MKALLVAAISKLMAWRQTYNYTVSLSVLALLFKSGLRAAAPVAICSSTSAAKAGATSATTDLTPTTTPQ